MRRETQADVARLRAVLAQLTAAISAIHDARKLHLDLKPANVMVREDGRVVVLDFGLVRDMPLDLERPGDAEVRGTPAYMAPEQAMGERLTQAADWYAVGAILFRILTGQLLPQKPYRDLGPPSNFVTGVPADLDELCVALLRRDPAVRAGAAEALRCVPVESALDAAVRPRRPPRAGRLRSSVARRTSAACARAFEATRRGSRWSCTSAAAREWARRRSRPSSSDDLRRTGRRSSSPAGATSANRFRSRRSTASSTRSRTT
jgi:serine/threonine protein kinase